MIHILINLKDNENEVNTKSKYILTNKEFPVSSHTYNVFCFLGNPSISFCLRSVHFKYIRRYNKFKTLNNREHYKKN